MKLRVGIATADRVPASKVKDNRAHWGGAGWVRLAQYIPYLEDQDIEVHVGYLVWDRTHFAIDVSEGTGEQVLVEVDIIYLQRLMHDTLSDRIKEAQSRGQIILNDIDDWYWGLATTNKAFLSSHPKLSPGENVNHYKSVLNSSNVVTVSTPYLADRLKAFVRCPIEIIPNYVNVEAFSPVDHFVNEVPTVGWVGSTSHRSSDVEILTGTFNSFLHDGAIRVLHSGHVDGAPLFADSIRLPKEQVMTINGTDPEQYASLLVMNIGVAPLNDRPFNHAKSDIKILEYAAAGIPWIGSALPSYSRLAQEWGVGRLAKRPKDWTKHIKELLDPNVRATEGSALRDLVWQRDIKIGAQRLGDFLKSQLP